MNDWLPDHDAPVAPTVSTNGSSPGEVTTPAPSLPAAVTTVMPLAHSASTAESSGFAWYGNGVCTPNDRFSTRMLLVSACSATQPRPATSFDSVVVPLESPTLTDTTLAPGASPMPSPTTSPAMNVPWP